MRAAAHRAAGAAFAAVTAISAQAAAATCVAPSPDYTTVADADHTLHLRPAGGRIPVGQPFTLELVLCAHDPTRSARGVVVDATMPGHGHGMLYKATTTPQGNNRWTSQGLVFHMPGHWRLRVAVDTGSGTRALVHDLHIR